MRHMPVWPMLMLGLLFSLLLSPSSSLAACPYTSMQIRVQPNTSTAWTQSISVAAGTQIHVGVFKNGWGVPVDPGVASVVAVNGSTSQAISLSSGWEAWWSAPSAGTWSLRAHCNGTYMEAATATFTSTSINVLSYVRPGGANGVVFSTITNLGNPWRTFAWNNGNIGERLPGFFITKGNLDYNTYKAWNFEQMIYDSSWIYLVRDTSWTSTCKDTGREAGMLLFTNVNGQWLRGGRHFPRFIANGASVSTGEKFIQGVRKKKDPSDNEPNEGQWCDAHYSGPTSSTVRADLLSSYSVGGRTFTDVLKLSITGGSGMDDVWWFAKGYGLIRFSGPGLGERFQKFENPYEIGVRIPCEPNSPCM